MLRLTKTNSDVLDYTFQFAVAADSWLASGEQINSADVLAATGIAVSSITNMNSAVSFFAGSGQPDAVYLLECLIFTNQGRAAVRSFDLAVVETL